MSEPCIGNDPLPGCVRQYLTLLRFQVPQIHLADPPASPAAPPAHVENGKPAAGNELKQSGGR